MRQRSFRRTLALVGTVLMLALVGAPAAMAGGDGCDDDEDCATGGDTGSAVGGVQTGAGGMASSDGGADMLALGLAGGAIVVLTAAGRVALRPHSER